LVSKREERLDKRHQSFHLYGLDRDDADYVLGTLPIVAREERETERLGWGRFPHPTNAISPAENGNALCQIALIKTDASSGTYRWT
jgi:hypothetical protein